MGNANQSGFGDVGTGSALSGRSDSVMKGHPLTFHTTHSENIMLSPDRRRARRCETFCKGICFSGRPISINERVYLRFAEVSTSWSGVLRFGFMSHDPATMSRESLPRYACPDLTNKPGYWAKALPERFAQIGNVLMFFVTRAGDVVFGINGEEKGVFFSGVSTGQPVWALVDIYGNTTSMEFVDGRQLNNFTSVSASAMLTSPRLRSDDRTVMSPAVMPSLAINRASINPTFISTHQPVAFGGFTHLALGSGAVSASATSLPIRYHAHLQLSPLPFHEVVGRNICLSADRTIAVRRVEEYCNSYVFTSRPVRLGERIVIQILSTDHAYTGGLAFGMTAADPAQVRPMELPDDSDLLLDRPEYWIVNKDVCANSEVGDELSFHVTDEGEIRYGKNGHHVSTLMHIDASIPMWAFFDVYGNTQKIKILGSATNVVPSLDGSVSSASLQGSGLVVLLPPPTPAPRSHSASPSLPVATSTITPPPRPPPPQLSGLSSAAATTTAAWSSPLSSNGFSPAIPALPPKQPRPASQHLTSAHHHLAFNSSPLPSVFNSDTVDRPAPPVPSNPPLVTSYPTPPFQPSATVRRSAPPPIAQRRQTVHPPSPPSGSDDRSNGTTAVGISKSGMEESMDNASNECAVCLEKPADCVLYMCGHVCMCFECATDIKSKPTAGCPICRQPIKDIIKIYRS